MNGAEALDELYWTAEILQALYWMRGEGLAREVSPAALAQFLVADGAIVIEQMQRLAAEGYLERTIDGCTSARVPGVPADGGICPHTAYRLTPLGVAEGGRSFQDEFEGLTKQAHGECGPRCWCKDPERAGEPCPSHEEAPYPEPPDES